MKVFRHQGFIGSIEASLEDKCLYGKLLYTNDLVTYEAKTIPELEKEFKKAIKDYLETCRQLNREPIKTFTGSFNVRIGRELHKKTAFQAATYHISINEFIKRALEKQLATEA